MAQKEVFLRGCFMGMAVGDAFGDIVNDRSLQDIFETYGPYGIMGYDPNSHGPQITAYTQVAAYTINAVLMGVERGKLRGDYLPEITAALREWVRLKSFPGDLKSCRCWISHKEPMRRKKNLENGAVFYLGQGMTPGTLTGRRNVSNNPGLLTAAASLALVRHANCIRREDLAMLAASVVALVYGKTSAHFSGAFVAVLLDRILEEPDLPLQTHAEQTLAEIEGGEYPFSEYGAVFRPAMEAMFAQAQMPQMEHTAYMEQLDCYECQQVVLGALYACAVSFADMDRALVTAVNHSGKSAVVAALTGAILGAAQGEGALPEFYMEGLDAEEILLELLHDLLECTRLDSRVFNFDWDRKYNMGPQ